MEKIKNRFIYTAMIAFGWMHVSCDSPTKPERLSDGSGIQFAEIQHETYSHGEFLLSGGIYRIPYSNGTDVLVTQDHHTHGGETGNKDRIDMTAGKGVEIVAAAGGWIRGIIYHHGNDPNPGDGLAADGITAQDDSLEHACQDGTPAVPDSVVAGLCQQHNNYVWIEHPNGEWTKYSHLGTGTVQLPPPAGFGWSEGDWISAGEVIGLENDIGRASGTHLHFEIARPADPDATLTWSTLGGFINLNAAQNLVPVVCDENGGTFLYAQGETNTANPCSHLPPVADAGGPYEVDEGTTILLNGTGSFDPDGLPLIYSWSPGDNLNDTTLVQPSFVAGASMAADLTLTVYDQIEALFDSDNTTVTVNNVAPDVVIDPGQVTVINEGGSVTVVAEFTDPGWLDTHTADIDWGVPEGQEGIELASAAIQILNSGGPDDPLTGRVTGTYRYGDTDDGSGFTITVTVTDSDGGEGSDSFPLTVNNVDPAVSIDLSGAVMINGVPTVIAAIGEEVEFNGHATDPGSDDLTLTWDWGDGTSGSRLSLVNSPNTDPLPSPEVQPRDEPDQRTHTFTDACLFEVTFTATDDDGGEGSETVDVIIAGLADQIRGAGYWMSEYRMTKNPDFSPATLECYLEITNHVSAVFSDHRNLFSVDDAVDVLWTRGQNSADDLFDRHLLAAWLNFANGAFELDQMVDSAGDGIPDISFQNLMEQAENLRTNPARTRPEVLAMKDLLERLNEDHDL